MKKIIFTALTILIISDFASAQFIFNFGPELGICISRLPNNDSYVGTIGDIHVSEKTMPLFGPLGGLHAQLILKKLVLLTTGVQYEICGTRYTCHEEGTNVQYSLPFTADIKENVTFNKLCLPLSAGITFPLFKLHLSVYGGWRANYFLEGRYYKKTEIVYPSKSAYNSTTIEDYDPLKKNECVDNIKPLNNQVFFGLSVSKGRFEFALNHYVGQFLYFTAQPLVGNIEYNNNDNLFSVRYRFYGLRKRKTPCNFFSLATNN